MNKMIFILMIFLSTTSWAQTSPNITSGRPGVSIGTEVVGTQVFQVQSGVTLNRYSESNKTDDWVSDNFLRYGLDERFEVSTNINYRIHERIGSGIDNLMIGGRVNLIAEADGWIPSLAFQTRWKMKGSGDFKNEEIRPENILSSIHNIGRAGIINLNLTHSYSGDGGHPIYGYIANWTIALDDKWSVFLEEYAQHDGEQWSHAWDTGAAYLVHKDLQLDFSFGYDLESGYNSSFYSLGVSWRTSLI